MPGQTFRNNKRKTKGPFFLFSLVIMPHAHLPSFPSFNPPARHFFILEEGGNDDDVGEVECGRGKRTKKMKKKKNTKKKAAPPPRAPRFFSVPFLSPYFFFPRPPTNCQNKLPPFSHPNPGKRVLPFFSSLSLKEKRKKKKKRKATIS